MAFTIELRHTAVALPAVTVTAVEDLRRKSYYLDADAIENSSRRIVDGIDIFKIRPDMLNSRGGAGPCLIPKTPHDGWIENVFVNGRRIRLVPLDPMALARRNTVGLEPIRQPLTQRGRNAVMAGDLPPHAQPKLDTVLTIMQSIKAEHIAEVTYHDCFDASVGRNGSEMAVFVVLKPGIGFEPGVGSYVLSDSVMKARLGTNDNAMQVGDFARHRFRMLGVFDGSTGDPVAGAEVRDTTSGTSALTSATGTLSLFFLPEGGATVRIRKAGMRDTTLFIAISPADTVPITLVLSKPF
jgi:hypothetical protein